MNIYQKLAFFTSGLTLLMTVESTPASAEGFNFSYFGSNINGSVNTSGLLKTGSYNPTSNSYQITDITGTRNGVEIDSLLPPGSFSSENQNDNLLFPNSPQIDFFGFSYTAGGITYNPFSISTGMPSLYGENSTSGVIVPITFSATPADVPEPSSVLGILTVGVLIKGTLLKRKLKLSSHPLDWKNKI